MNEHPSLSERLNMRSIILTLLLILFPATIFAVNNNKKIFYAEEGGGPLPAAVEALLKRTSPDTANTCGFSGKELLLSNKPNDSHYYAIGPRSGSCIGSGGTTLWVAQLKNKKAAILIENIGTEIIQLETVSHGLHNLKFTGGSTRDFETSEWSYDGSKYQLIKQTNFTPEDCADGTKSKDPDFPWNCEN